MASEGNIHPSLTPFCHITTPVCPRCTRMAHQSYSRDGFSCMHCKKSDKFETKIKKVQINFKKFE